MKYISLAVAAAALLGHVTAINNKQSLDLQQQSGVEALTELNRYIGSDGQPINLAQTSGHVRLGLTQIQKYNRPAEITNIQLEQDNGGNKSSGKTQISIPMIYIDYTAYVAEIFVGTPPQKVKALFDTGSANAWVVGKNVKMEVRQNGTMYRPEQSYDETKSSTFQNKLNKQPVAIKFGSGNLKGHFVTDDIKIGSINIKNQQFGIVDEETMIFAVSNFEALIGMAQPQLAEKDITPVFDSMINQKLLNNNIFAFYLTSKAAANQGKVPELTIGYYDKDKFHGDVHWYKVDHERYFSVRFENILFNGKESNICPGGKLQSGNNCLITFDSGANGITMPKVATEFLAQQGVPLDDHVKKCESPEQYGTMAFVIGGQKYEFTNQEWMMPAKTMNRQSLVQGGKTQVLFQHQDPLGPQILTQINDDDFLDNNVEYDSDLIQAQADVNAGKMTQFNACTSQIRHMELAKELFIVGDQFMRKYYTIFDRDQKRVGLALSKWYYEDSQTKGGQNGKIGDWVELNEKIAKAK